AYDGRRFRIVMKSYSGGTLAETRHFYYSEQWQVLEERVDASTNPDRQYVWGLRYIDDLVLRDRDTTGAGTLDERLYALQDANWNVTAVVDPGGTVQERYAYSAYGEPVFLDPSFAVRSTSSFAWETLYTSLPRDNETQFYYSRLRYYCSTVGAFGVRDALDYVNGMNLYAAYFAVNDTDPFGAQAPARPGPVRYPLPPRPSLRIYNPEHFRPLARESALQQSLGNHRYLGDRASGMNFDNPYTLHEYHGYFQLEHIQFLNRYERVRQATQADIAWLKREIANARRRGVSEDDIWAIAGSVLQSLTHGSISDGRTPSPFERIPEVCARLRNAPTQREKCQNLHRKYKWAEGEFRKSPCSRATNCAELLSAIQFLVYEITFRAYYINSD
ncbi:hypothetical protein D6833_01415, partial [Candidatus Parcubacteria bacterium]